MKKFALVAILTCLLAILTACGSSDTIEANQEFLEDLDYMLYVLQENFGLFDVAYWARGVDINAIIEDIRAEVISNPDMTTSEFYTALEVNFAPLRNMGHFAFISPSLHRSIVHDPTAWHHWFFSESALDRLSYPHVLAFYEAEMDAWEYVLSEVNLARLAQSADLVVDILTWHGEYELAAEYIQALEAKDAENAVKIFGAMEEIRFNAPNVITKTLEEGRIAYLTFDSFWHMAYTGSPIDMQIQDFFEEIRDYEHLIIDLRRTGGGDVANFTTYIMGPNIDAHTRVDGFVFYRYGPYVAPYAIPPFAAMRLVTNWSVRPATLSPIDEKLAGLNLPQLNMDDMQRMDYGFSVSISQSARRLARFDNQPAFNGQIWLLTGPHMGSAVQIAAWVAKESGFATLVGEITGGVLGGPRTFIALPNSGIAFQMDLFYITDAHGRPLEAGTIPHYFNRPGMDALETVLAMIAEGLWEE
jgi:hypothetical protein